MDTLRKAYCLLYRRVVRLLFGMLAIWLFTSSLVVTNYLTFNEQSWLCPVNTVFLCLLFVGICACCLFWGRLDRKHPSLEKRTTRGIRFLLILAAGILAAWWVGFSKLRPLTDAKHTMWAGQGLVEGSYQIFENGNYMSVYPHQSGLALYHCLIMMVFGMEDVLVFQYLNVIAYMGILWCLGELCKELGMGEGGALAVTVLGVLFFPMMLYVTFVYGTLQGMALSMAGLLLCMRSGASDSCRQGMWGALLLTLGVFLKKNFQIYVIAAVLYLAYMGLRRKNRKCLAVIAVLLAGMLLATKLPIQIVERMTGCVLNNGFPTSTWLVMGLSQVPEWSPGWWNGYANETYALSGKNAVIQNRMAMEDLKIILAGYVKNPISFVRFELFKNFSQWLEPLYQGVWLNNAMMVENLIELPQWARTMLSTHHQFYLGKAMRVFQSFVYGGLMLWAWIPSPEKRKGGEDLLAVTMLGGFLFHCVWEAKGQYTMPYYVLVFPLALLGYSRLTRLAERKDALKENWKKPTEKLRWMVPVLCLAAALVLSPVLSGTLHEVQEMFLAESLRENVTVAELFSGVK